MRQQQPDDIRRRMRLVAVVGTAALALPGAFAIFAAFAANGGLPV